MQTPHIRIAVVAASLLALITAPRPLQAQDAPMLQVQTANHQTTFHLGERIPLQLSFTSTTPDRYQISMASYDRSGRMAYETFAVSPDAGWADPLRHYFGTSLGFMGGGLSSSRFLTPEPTSLTIDLNEWVRFDKPGDYRVTVISHRVTDTKQKAADGFAAGQPLTAAAPLLLHVVPATPQWQTSMLQTIVNVLNATAAMSGNDSSAVRRDTVANLRFLGTAEAIPVLAANLRDDRQDLEFQCGLGLVSLPDTLYGAAREALAKQMNAPDFPIGGWLLQALTVLNIPETATPEQRQTAWTAAHNVVWREALAALSTKTGTARALTAETLLNDAPPANLDPETQRQLGIALAAALPNLSEEQRTSVLAYRWDAVRSPSLLPMLQSFAKLPLQDPDNNVMDSYTRRQLKSIAVQRWYGLDPDGALREIAAQIGTAHPALTAASLHFLPAEQKYPEFEPVWAAALADGNAPQQTLLGLLARFGTGTATGQVAGLAQRLVGHWACAPQASALAYLVQFSPEDASPLLDRALRANKPGETGCYHGVLRAVAAEADGDVLHKAAVGALPSQDPEVVIDAAVYLTAHGKPEDKVAIQRRYDAWHDQWAGQAEALEPVPIASAANHYAYLSQGQTLAGALIANQGWLATAEEVAHTGQRCVSKQMCRYVQQLAELANPPYRVSLYAGRPTDENLHVAQYGPKTLKLFREKIAQYPRGTIFLLSPSGTSEEEQHLESQARRIFEDEGMTLQLLPNK